VTRGLTELLWLWGRMSVTSGASKGNRGTNMWNQRESQCNPVSHVPLSGCFCRG